MLLFSSSVKCAVEIKLPGSACFQFVLSCYWTGRKILTIKFCQTVTGCLSLGGCESSNVERVYYFENDAANIRNNV